MVREDILNWLKAAMVRGENANDAAIKLIVAGHDMYEVNDALRQLTSEISDKRFEINKIHSFKDNVANHPVSSKPHPSKEIRELPITNLIKRTEGLFSRRRTIIMIWALIALITVITVDLIYLTISGQ